MSAMMMNVAGSRCCTLWFRIDPSQLKNRLTGAHIANLRTLSSLRLFRYRRLGTLAGEYVGASGDIGIGLGAGANVLVGGSNRSIALQPVSLEGSVALNVVAGLSQLKLRPVPQ
jgi:hypothetical protein